MIKHITENFPLWHLWKASHKCQLHMLWENGRSLALIPGHDNFHILPQPEPEKTDAEPDIEMER